MRKIAAAALILAASSAQAQFFDGQALMDRMWTTDNMHRAMALGYVAGVFDTGRGTLFCPPGSVTLGQAHDLVRSYLDANQSMRRGQAAIIALAALETAWPCQNQRRGRYL